MNYKDITTRTKFLKIERSDNLLKFTIVRTLEKNDKKTWGGKKVLKDDSYTIYLYQDTLLKDKLDFDSYSYVKIDEIANENKLSIMFCHVGLDHSTRENFYINKSKFEDFINSDSKKIYFMINEKPEFTKYEINERASKVIKEIRQTNKELLRQLVKTLLYMRYGYKDLTIYSDGRQDFYFERRVNDKYISNGGIIKHSKDKKYQVNGELRTKQIPYYGIHTWLSLLGYIILLCSSIET